MVIACFSTVSVHLTRVVLAWVGGGSGKRWKKDARTTRKAAKTIGVRNLVFLGFGSQMWGIPQPDHPHRVARCFELERLNFPTLTQSQSESRSLSTAGRAPRCQQPSRAQAPIRVRPLPFPGPRILDLLSPLSSFTRVLGLGVTHNGRVGPTTATLATYTSACADRWNLFGARDGYVQRADRRIPRRRAATLLHATHLA